MAGKGGARRAPLVGLCQRGGSGGRGRKRPGVTGARRWRSGWRWVRQPEHRSVLTAALTSRSPVSRFELLSGAQSGKSPPAPVPSHLDASATSAKPNRVWSRVSGNLRRAGSSKDEAPTLRCRLCGRAGSRDRITHRRALLCISA